MPPRRKAAAARTTRSRRQAQSDEIEIEAVPEDERFQSRPVDVPIVSLEAPTEEPVVEKEPVILSPAVIPALPSAVELPFELSVDDVVLPPVVKSSVVVEPILASTVASAAVPVTRARRNVIDFEQVLDSSVRPPKRSKASTTALPPTNGIATPLEAVTAAPLEKTKPVPVQENLENTKSLPIVPAQETRNVTTTKNVTDTTIPLKDASEETDAQTLRIQRLHSERRRRSSFSQLGKRFSSMRGQITLTLPHSSIAPSCFHQHISQELPDPVRMKQLLIWSLQVVQRANADHEQLSNLIGRLIQGYAENEIGTSWFHRPASVKRSNVVVKPNPLNESMKQSLALYNQRYTALKQEYAAWIHAVDSKTDKVSTVKEDAETIQALQRASSVLQISQETLSAQPWPLLVGRLDAAHVQLCRSSQFVQHAHVYCEKTFTRILKTFFPHDNWPNENEESVSTQSNYNKIPDGVAKTPMSVLRQLSRRRSLLNEH